MNHEEARRLIPHAELIRLKQVANSIEIDMLFGRRILAECIEPSTKMDTVYKELGIIIPKDLKKDYTPMPTTGIVLGLGAELDPATCPVKVGSMIMFSKHSGTDFVFTDDNRKEDTAKRWRILDIDEVICTCRTADGESLMAKVVPIKEIDTTPDVPTVAGTAILG